MKAKVSVIIPNYNGKDYLENCVRSLFAQDVKSFEIIIVDDASTDNSFEELKSKFPDNGAFPLIRYSKHSENKGFCASVNDGIRLAETPYILLLNNDTVADTEMVRSLYSSIKRSEKIFSVGAKMISLHNKNVLDDTGDLYSSIGWAFAPGKDKDISRYNKRCHTFACCGGAAIYRKDILTELGLFDENHFAYLEDIDIGYRAKLAGYVNIYEPEAVVYHAGSASSGSRHNDFKVKLSARNSIYLAYKNMPTWQLIFNGPQLLAGIMIKTIFFARKGLAGSYVKGIFEGFSMCKNSEGMERRKLLKSVPFSRQLSIELELLINTFRRITG